MNKYLTILVFFMTLSFYSCTKQKDLTEDELYSILNGIIENDSIWVDSLCPHLSHLEISEEFRKEFSLQDMQFINRQNRVFRNFNLKSNKLKKHSWRKLKPNASPYISLDTNCKGKNFSISFPMISIDRKKVIIEISGGWGFLCGFSSCNLYTFKNNHWVMTKTFNYIIS